MSLGGGSTSQDFDLNLAPIIDCFVVLIAFVMISSAFASVAVLDAGVAAGSENEKTQVSPPIQISVILKSDLGLSIKVSGKENSNVYFPQSQLGQFTNALVQIKEKWPGVTTATLVADDHVPYQDVITSMDLIRKQIPDVLLGGF